MSSGQEGSTTQSVRADIEAVERDETLEEEANFVERAEVLDLIEFHIVDRIDGLLQDGYAEDLARLRGRAESLKSRLEAVDELLFRQIRADIRSGDCTCKALWRRLRGYATQVSKAEPADVANYDALDAFVSGLLRIAGEPEETKEREPDMVALQATPVRVILEMIEVTPVTSADVFYDVGSGLGQVPILVHLLTGAAARGIEFEPSYCDYARRCAQGLRLKQVEFANRDARSADYSDGTIYFMYTPFTGAMLQEVLDRLRDESRGRKIKVCTYGPCTPQVYSQSWLRCTAQNIDRAPTLAVFESVGIPHKSHHPGSST
jgi:hypothetical protein